MWTPGSLLCAAHQQCLISPDAACTPAFRNYVSNLAQTHGGHHGSRGTMSFAVPPFKPAQAISPDMERLHLLLNLKILLRIGVHWVPARCDYHVAQRDHPHLAHPIFARHHGQDDGTAQSRPRQEIRYLWRTKCRPCQALAHKLHMHRFHCLRSGLQHQMELKIRWSLSP